MTRNVGDERDIDRIARWVLSDRQKVHVSTELPSTRYRSTHITARATTETISVITWAVHRCSGGCGDVVWPATGRYSERQWTFYPLGLLFGMSQELNMDVTLAVSVIP